MAVAERLAHLRIQLAAVEVTADVAELGREPVEHFVVEVLAGLLDRVAGAAPKIVVGEVLASHPEHGHIEQPTPLQPVERAERLLLGQVAGYPEDDKGVGFAFAHRFDLLRLDFPRLRSFFASATSSAAGPPWSRPVSSTPGSFSNLGSDRNTAQPLVAQLALAHDRVPVAVGAEPHRRVVRVQRPEAVEPDDAVELVDHLPEGLRRADVIARGEQVARVQADAEPLAAPGGVEQPGELLERPPERAAGACRVLEVQVAAVGLRQSLLDDLAGALDRLADVALLGRARVQDHARCADAGTHSQRLSQRDERLLAHLAIGRGAVDQVDGVDQDGLDRAVGDRLAELFEVVFAVRGRPPHARRLAEDLDRLAASFDSALDRAIEPAGVRDVCAD